MLGGFYLSKTVGTTFLEAYGSNKYTYFIDYASEVMAEDGYELLDNSDTVILSLTYFSGSFMKTTFIIDTAHNI